jgi:hypothetical protein
LSSLKKKIVIEGGFHQSILLWILTISIEYCNNKNIKEIILEKKNEKILNNKFIKNQLKNFKIIFLEDLLPYYLKNNFFLYIILLPKSFLFSLYWKKINLKNLNWEQYQFFHSIIDTQQSLSNDGVINPSYYITLKSIYLNFKKKKIAQYLIRFNIGALITSHNVYTVKTFNSIFRKKNIPVFCHAAFNLYKLPKNRDENWNNLLNIKLRNQINNKLNIKKINSYWKKKFRGKGDYLDSNLSYQKRFSNNKIKNIIMLHIFRDSPFINLDKKRIFLNYINWVDETINIIKNSSEIWHFKIHPNSKRWGENPLIFLEKLIKKHNAKNVRILKTGNIGLMKNLKKIVTFSGSVTEEAISLGIKPIIISNTPIYIYDKSIVLKPKNLKDYAKMLNSSDLKIFKSSEDQKKIAKKFIYCNEKIMSIRKDINAMFLYRNEQTKKKRDYFMVNKYLVRNLSFLKKNGYILSKGYSHTLSREGINLINQ